MPTINNTEHLRTWFRTCPALLGDNRFRVDYIAEAPTEYAIYSVPTSILYHENVLGESIPNDVQTLNFVFASKEYYGADVTQNLANLGFYQDVVEWIIYQNSMRRFPRINDGRVLSVVPTLTAYPIEAGADSAKYQIQIKMTYRRC